MQDKGKQLDAILQLRRKNGRPSNDLQEFFIENSHRFVPREQAGHSIVDDQVELPMGDFVHEDCNPRFAHFDREFIQQFPHSIYDYSFAQYNKSRTFGLNH